MHDHDVPDHDVPDHGAADHGAADHGASESGDRVDDDWAAYESFRGGDRLLASGNPHAAIVALERARDLEPETASVRETLARAYYRTGRYDAAAAEFAVTVDLDPVNDYGHFGLGLALARTGDVVGARRHLRIAAVMRPDNADYARALADVTDPDPADDSADPGNAGAP